MDDLKSKNEDLNKFEKCISLSPVSIDNKRDEIKDFILDSNIQSQKLTNILDSNIQSQKIPNEITDYFQGINH